MFRYFKVKIYILHFNPDGSRNRIYDRITSTSAEKGRIIINPLNENHNQPRIPLNNNYYDQSNPDTQKAQVDLALKYGIDGFNFYHSIKDIKNVHLNKTVLNPIENYQSLSWVDLRKLSELYTKKYDLQDINFFTAFPKHRPKDQQYRHKIYIKTLKDYLKINIIEGKFRTYSKNENISCNHCNKIFNHKEINKQ
jgi:hypothetical protein